MDQKAIKKLSDAALLGLFIQQVRGVLPLYNELVIRDKEVVISIWAKGISEDWIKEPA